MWRLNAMVYPDAAVVPLPNPDLDDDVRSDYQEAATVVSRSPRSAAALLRLALQKLCIQLGQKGDKIDDDIKALVKNGLSVEIQQAMDALRVIGNNAVHPGELDLRDDVETALKLFALVNIIADRMITEKKRIAALYEQLPETSRTRIEERDAQS